MEYRKRNLSVFAVSIDYEINKEFLVSQSVSQSVRSVFGTKW